MVSRPLPPSASTPIHPRLLELAAASAIDSPSSTPGSAVTASSVDKSEATRTLNTEDGNDEDDDNVFLNNSGESLGIRARRPGSPVAHSSNINAALDDVQRSPLQSEESDTSKTTEAASGDSSLTHDNEKHHPTSSNLPSFPPSSPSSHSARPDQLPLTTGQEGNEENNTRLSMTAPPSHSRIKDITNQLSSFSLSTGRSSAFYSPPPPNQGTANNGGASKRGGDYYSSEAIPSPKLEPIPELSGEISRLKSMSETPFKQSASFQRQIALASLRQSPSAASLLHEILTNSSPDKSAKLSCTPDNRTGTSFNDSMFESPLLAPMAPYGSPIRFKQPTSTLTDAASYHEVPSLAQGAASSPQKALVPIPLSKRLTIRRPPGSETPLSNKSSPLKREEADIRSILWKSSPFDGEDAANADIQAPEVEQLGPQSSSMPDFQFQPQNLPNVHSEQYGKVAPTPAQVQSGKMGIQSQPGRDLNQNKIPTLVGPNSLPYARCPSGVDSFAFDLANPRPYDAVMPPRHEYRIPKSISCDDKLLYRAEGEKTSEMEEQANEASGDTQPLHEDVKAVPAYFPRANTTGSSHNERARQRMERVRMATMKREQARAEDQARKEVARLTRKLATEQEERNHTQAFNQHFDTYRSFGTRLNSTAAPFTPRSLAQQRFTREAGPPVYQFNPQLAFKPTAAPRPLFTSAAQNVAIPSSNAAEGAHPQNRLFSILQQRMHGTTTPLSPLEAHLQQQAPLLSALPASQVHGTQTGGDNSTGVLSAISTMMQSNQQLIAMLQEAEKALVIGNPAHPSTVAMGYRSPPGLEHVTPTSRITFGVADPYAFSHMWTAPFQSAPDAYRFPANTVNTPRPATAFAEVNAPSVPFQPNHSASNDSAVVSARRKSVTFDTALESNILLSSNKAVRDVHSTAQSAPVHGLPVRPLGLEVSHKLMGVVPTMAGGANSPAHASGTAKNKVAAANERASLQDSTSTISPSEADVRHRNRSNAPSPEDLTVLRPITRHAGNVRAASGAHTSKLPTKSNNNHNTNGARRPMAEKSANNSNISISSSKGEFSRRQRSSQGKEDLSLPAEKVKKTKPTERGNRRSTMPNDRTWSSFVRQMGGVSTTSPRE